MDKVSELIKVLDCGELRQFDNVIKSLDNYKKAKEIVERTHIAMGRKTIVDFTKIQVTNIKTNVNSIQSGITTGVSPKI